MKAKYEEFMERGELDPKEFKRIERERAEGAHILTTAIAKKKPEQLPEILAGLKPSEILSALKPELLAGLKPEERQQLRKLLTEQTKEQ